MNLSFKFSEKYAANVKTVIILSARDAPKMKNMKCLFGGIERKILIVMVEWYVLQFWF